MRNCFVCALLWLSSCLASHAEPQLARTDVFKAGAEGYALYRIPGIVVTRQGTVLAYAEARRTGKSDWDAIDILLRRSLDGGKSWDEAHKIADVPGTKSKNPALVNYRGAKPDDVTYNNPVAIADRDGSVHFLFCLEYMRCFYLRSDDDGITWSRPVEISGAFERFRSEWDWKVLATGPGHGIQLKNGRLVVPVWLSTGAGGGNAHRPSVSATIFSDDSGKTWQSGDISIPNTDAWINPSETVVVQLADGHVLLNARSESTNHLRLVTTSPDGAKGWARPQFADGLLEPVCMASIARVTQMPTGRRNRIVFANPHNLARADGKESPGKGRDRRNLTIKLTYDECLTWPVSKVLETGVSAYSDLAVTREGTILCFYERGSGSNACLTLARFNLDWLTDGKDAWP